MSILSFLMDWIVAHFVDGHIELWPGGGLPFSLLLFEGVRELHHLGIGRGREGGRKEKRVGGREGGRAGGGVRGKFV